MSIKLNSTLDRDNLNRAFVSKSATGTQIMAGSLRLLGGITVDGTFTAGNTTLGTLTAGVTTLGALTITGALSAGAQTITTTGRVNAGTFAGNGAAITALNGTNISAGTVADARLSTNVVLLNTAQTFTANNTYSATANLFFAGGTTYKIDTTGSASFNALNVAGNVTLDGNDYVTFGSAGLSVPGNSSVGTKIKLYGESYQIGINSGTVWYDSNANHQFYSNGGTVTRVLNAEISPLALNAYNDLNVSKNLDVYGEFKAGVNNEFPDPLVASKTANEWATINGSSVFDAAQFPPGTGAIGSIKTTATAIDNYSIYSYDFDVSPSEWITFSAYAFATAASKTAQLHIQWRTSAKAIISNSSVDFTAALSWTRQQLTAQAPATARYFRVRIDNDTSGAIMYWSAFQVERGRALTGFKPYQGGKETSLLHNGINSILYSQYPLRLSNSTFIDGDLTINNGANTTVNITHSPDTGEAVLNIMGVSGNGTGRVFVGQSSTYGGGIEYNGDALPAGSGSGDDYFTLYRRSNNLNFWTARNSHDSHDWEFRGKVKIGTDLELVNNIQSVTPVGFTTPVGAAMGVNMGALLVSNAYADVSKVPTNGAWIKGNIVTSGTLSSMGAGINGDLSIAGNMDIAVPTTGTVLTGNNRFAGVHLKQALINDNFVGITASSNATGTQAGVLFQGSASYGTKMHFMTTASHASGMQQQMTLDNNGNLGVGTPTPGFKLHVVGTGNITGATTIGGTLAVTGALTGSTITSSGVTTAAGFTLSSGVFTHTTADSYDKIRVYSGAQYTIGFKSAQTFGYLSDYAMTFTMNNAVNRGFLWRDEADAVSDGAMSLTTDGRLHVKDIANVGSLNVRGAATFGGSVTFTGGLTLGSLNGTYGLVFRSVDEWLRINDDSSHASGVYFGTSLVRTDGTLQAGPAGQFKATGAGVVTATSVTATTSLSAPNIGLADKVEMVWNPTTNSLDFVFI